MQPDNIWVKLLKVKYLRNNSDFRHLAKPKNASPALRNILDHRQLINKGII